MNTLTFIKLAIIEGLKPCFPKTTLGIPDGYEEIVSVNNRKASNYKVPVDYVCKGLCSSCKHYGK